jgi:hypothetical protein
MAEARLDEWRTSAGSMESRLHPRSPAIHTWLHVLARSTNRETVWKMPVQPGSGGRTMVSRMLLTIAVTVGIPVISNTAYAQLAPQRASDLVTLRQSESGEHCINRTTGVVEGFKMTNQVVSTGYILPFVIPNGKVLVITDWQWGPSFVGPNVFEPVSLLLQGGGDPVTVSASGSNSPGANSTSANGQVGSSASVVGWVAVRPATDICVNGGAQPNPFAIVHGFLATDE